MILKVIIFLNRIKQILHIFSFCYLKKSLFKKPWAGPWFPSFTWKKVDVYYLDISNHCTLVRSRLYLHPLKNISKVVSSKVKLFQKKSQIRNVHFKHSTKPLIFYPVFRIRFNMTRIHPEQHFFFFFVFFSC